MAFFLIAFVQVEGAGAEEEKFVWFPEDLLFRPGLADPRAPFTGSRLQFPIRRRDHVKIENVISAHRTVFRVPGEEDAFEFQAEAAAFSRFDVNENLDMDGVDYRFGFPFVYRRGELALKLHPWHITSHLGDEIIEREGLHRISYARNELALGVSLDLGGEGRTYAEVGWGFSVGDPNDPWRAQAGAEFFTPLGTPSPHFFAAVNLTSSQEIDWDAQLTLQTGLWIRPARSPRGFRVGLEYYRGHSVLTQFFRRHEHYGSVGVWLHF